MPGVVIRDGTEPRGHGGLKFELAHILEALGDRAISTRWRCQDLHYISRDDQDIATLEELGSGDTVDGTDLLAALPRLRQVIDGVFQAIQVGDEPWVTVRAVDSS